MPDDGSGIDGLVEWVLTGPDGKVKGKGRAFNTITDVGDQRYGDAGAGIAGAPAAPTGMKLGTTGTAAAKNGAGSAIVAYLPNSNQAIGTPTSAKPATVRVVTYTATYAAGKATSASPIVEVALVNDTIATDANSTAANTLSRAVIGGIGSKGASDTLAITWTHSIGS
jgi:hypothetical protein